MNTFLYFAYFSSYLQTKKTTWKRGNAISPETVMQIIFLGPFWNTFIKIEQLKNLMALSLEGCWVSRLFQWFLWQYNNFRTENAIKLIKTIKESSHEHLNTYKTSSLFKKSCSNFTVRFISQLFIWNQNSMPLQTLGL